MDRTPTILLIGDLDHHELRESVAWLRAHSALFTASCVEQALQADEPGQCQYVLFALSRPGQIAPADVDRISRRYPLAHLVGLLGSLCEGEPVPRTPGPGVPRVYWHQFLARCGRELSRREAWASWQLPRTASEVERVETAVHAAPDQQSGLVALFTPSALTYDGLDFACRQAGYATVWCNSLRRESFHGAVAAVWDGATGRPVDFAQLGRLCQRWPALPVVALLGFPRYDQVCQARQLGAQAVLASPLLLPDLWQTLRSVRRNSH